MHRKLSILDFSRSVRAARLLSYALLLLFVYASTAEVVHSHRNLQRSIPTAGSSFLTDESSPGQKAGTTSSNDCLACQFQQNLSTAEVVTPHLILSAPVIVRSADNASVSFLSPSRTTGHGRAPPVTC